MAAGMWQGLLAGYQSVEEKRAAREAKEEELLERRKGLAMELAMRYGTGRVSGGSADGASASSQSIEHISQVLSQQFDVSDEVITRVAGAAGATGLNQAFNILESTRNRFAELGREMPAEVVNNLFEDAVLTSTPSEPIDFGRLEEFIGGALDPLEREYISASRPPAQGEAYFRSPVVLDPPRLEDVDRLETRAIRDVTQRATIEIRNLNEALNNIRQTEESETDPTRLEALEDTKDWVINRQSEVRDALSSAEGEGGNPFNLINLYGNEYFTEMYQADPRLSQAVVAPVFREARNAAPKRVDSLAQLRDLARLGLIRVGDTVEVLDPSTGEYVLQTIGE